MLLARRRGVTCASDPEHPLQRKKDRKRDPSNRSIGLLCARCARRPPEAVIFSFPGSLAMEFFVFC